MENALQGVLTVSAKQRKQTLEQHSNNNNDNNNNNNCVEANQNTFVGVQSR